MLSTMVEVSLRPLNICIIDSKQPRIVVELSVFYASRMNRFEEIIRALRKVYKDKAKNTVNCTFNIHKLNNIEYSDF